MHIINRFASQIAAATSALVLSLALMAVTVAPQTSAPASADATISGMVA